jgi:hypothetical protein
MTSGGVAGVSALFEYLLVQYDHAKIKRHLFLLKSPSGLVPERLDQIG